MQRFSILVPFILSCFLLGKTENVVAQTNIVNVPADILSRSREYTGLVDYYGGTTTHLVYGGRYLSKDTAILSGGLLSHQFDADVFTIYGGTYWTSEGEGADHVGLGLGKTLVVGRRGSYSSLGDDGGYGTYIKGADLENQGSYVYAQADGISSTGIFVDGKYNQEGGVLILEAGTGVSLVAKTAEFDKDSRLVVEYDASDASNSRFGKMKVDNTLTVESGAKLNVSIVNSVNLKLGDSKTFDWLDGGTIDGNFTVEDTNNFGISFDSNSGTFTIERIRAAHQSLDGNNAKVALAVENGLAGNVVDHVPAPGYEGVYDLFTRLDNATNTSQMNDMTRRSSGWQSTKFGGMMFSNIDLEQNTLYNQLAVMRTDAYYESLAHSTLLGQTGCLKQVNPWTRWVAWNGNVGNFGGETASFESLKVDSCSVDLGMARRLALCGKGSLLGFNLSYNYGKFRDGNDSRDRSYTDGDYNGFSAVISTRTDFTKRNFWMDTTAGFSVASFGMSRRDYLGETHGSDTTAGIFRLGWAIGRDYGLRTHEYYYYYEHCRFTPILGLDYTLYAQDGLQEGNRTNGLALQGKGDSTHSLRGKAGLEFTYCYTDLSLSLHSFLRWDFFDDRLKLPTHFSTAPEVMYDLTAQPVSGVSGVLGLNLNWQLFENQDVGFAYDGIYGDHYNTHWFNLRYVRRF
jgi:hypothetical protein